jgi:hypothetical protein
MKSVAEHFSSRTLQRHQFDCIVGYSVTGRNDLRLNVFECERVIPLKILMGIVVGFALLLATTAQAELVRIPKQGEPAYAFDTPPGWKITYDEHGNLHLARGSVFLQLSIATGAALTGLTLDNMASQVLIAANMPPYTSRQVGSIAGGMGQIYFLAKAQNGITMNLSLTIVRLDDTHVATLIRITRADSAATDLRVAPSGRLTPRDASGTPTHLEGS